MRAEEPKPLLRLGRWLVVYPSRTGEVTITLRWRGRTWRLL